jgi:hypothetical protein
MTNRDTIREHAARLPFLLEGALAEVVWTDRCCWNMQPASDLVTGLAGVERLAFAARMGRILVTRYTEFLDDALFPPHACAGVIVVDEMWTGRLDEFLVTMVGLLGPFRALYQGVKAHGASTGAVMISTPAGRNRRVTRRFLFDGEGLPLLTEVASSDERKYAYSGYRPSGEQAGVLA